MTSPPAPAQPLGLGHIVRSAQPAQAIASCALLLLASVSFGLAPGLATALWLAVVSPSLVVFDVRVKRLPNVLVVPGLVTVLIDSAWYSIVIASFPLQALVTTVIVVAAMLALNLVGGLGMGDVKLSAVIAGCLSLVAPSLAVAAVMLSFFAGGAYSAVLLLRRRGQSRRRIAFGPVLLVAFWAVVVLHAVSTTWVVSLS